MRIASEEEITIKSPIVADELNQCIKDFLMAFKLMPTEFMQEPANDLAGLLQHSDISKFVIEQLFTFEFEGDQIDLFFELFHEHLNLDHLKVLGITCDSKSLASGFSTLYHLLNEGSGGVEDTPYLLRLIYQVFVSFGFSEYQNKIADKSVAMALFKKQTERNVDPLPLAMMASYLVSFDLDRTEEMFVAREVLSSYTISNYWDYSNFFSLPLQALLKPYLSSNGLQDRVERCEEPIISRELISQGATGCIDIPESYARATRFGFKKTMDFICKQ